MILSALLALAALGPEPPPELRNYVRRRDPSYGFTVKETGRGRTEIRLTSGLWRGEPWKHTIVLQRPSKMVRKGTAVLYITGGDPNPSDVNQLALLAEATGMPIAMLFNIPNQPLYGMIEDDLIAHTFQKYLETGDAEWPLLFPMARSAVRAMDALQGATKSSEDPLRRFVVTGASKRGWTTWMVAATGDKRVAGIAPMVIDNLNVPWQMRHQMETWGAYSEQIQDYTRRGLQQQMLTPRGRELARRIDPYSYRRNLTMPKLIVNGANDRYWQVDALSGYWSALPGDKWALVVPNVGHNLGGGLQAIETIGAFTRSIAGELKMPRPDWMINERSGGLVLARVFPKGMAPEVTKLWVALSDSLDFRESKWEPVATGSTTDPTLTRQYRLPEGRNAAVMREMRYRIDGRAFSLSSPVKVIRKVRG